MHPPILRVVSAISAESVLIEYIELNIENSETTVKPRKKRNGTRGHRRMFANAEGKQQ